MNTERLKQVSEAMGENFFERFVGAGNAKENEPAVKSDDAEKLRSDFENEKEAMLKRIAELEKDNEFLRRNLDRAMAALPIKWDGKK